MSNFKEINCEPSFSYKRFTIKSNHGIDRTTWNNGYANEKKVEREVQSAFGCVAFETVQKENENRNIFQLKCQHVAAMNKNIISKALYDNKYTLLYKNIQAHCIHNTHHAEIVVEEFAWGGGQEDSVASRRGASSSAGFSFLFEQT